MQKTGPHRRPAKRQHADVWRRIWDKLEDLGYPQAEVNFLHIKAHRSKADKAAMDEETRRRTAGNEPADRWAKEGAGGDAGHGREETLKAAAEQVQWTLDCIVESQGWIEQRGQRPDHIAQGSKPKPKGHLVLGPKRPHHMIHAGRQMAVPRLRYHYREWHHREPHGLAALPGHGAQAHRHLSRR